MKNYLFTDYATGEDFIVEALSTKNAIKIAKEYFADPCGDPEKITYEEAEMMGLDTY